MCQAASFVILKSGEVLFGKHSDSHEIIIKENNLTDTSRNPEFVRVEITPVDGNYASPFEKWQYKTDQDLLPEWFSAKWAEALCRKKLPEWAETHIYTCGEHNFDGGIFSLIFLGTAVGNISAQTGGDCWAHENATLNSSAQAGGDCWAYENATLNSSAQTGGYCRAYGNATINSSAQAGGYCRAHGNATFNRIDWKP